MPTFVFYPFLSNGVSLSFTSASLSGDAEALRHARDLLAEHSQAGHVDVWQGERFVGASHRGPRAGRVLIVEDCFMQADTWRSALVEDGYEEVRCCGGEADALAAIEAGAPDLALVDLNLGEGPSYGVLEALDERAVPFMIVTGYDLAVLPARWHDKPYLAKPATEGLVRAACHDMLMSVAPWKLPPSTAKPRAVQPGSS